MGYKQEYRENIRLMKSNISDEEYVRKVLKKDKEKIL